MAKSTKKDSSKELAGHFEYMVFSTPGQPFVVDISSLLPVSPNKIQVVVGGQRQKGTRTAPLAVNWEVDGTSGLALKLWAYDAGGNPPSMSDNDWAGAAIKIDYQVSAS